MVLILNLNYKLIYNSKQIFFFIISLAFCTWHKLFPGSPRRIYVYSFRSMSDKDVIFRLRNWFQARFIDPINNFQPNTKNCWYFSVIDIVVIMQITIMFIKINTKTKNIFCLKTPSVSKTTLVCDITWIRHSTTFLYFHICHKKTTGRFLTTV